MSPHWTRKWSLHVLHEIQIIYPRFVMSVLPNKRSSCQDILQGMSRTLRIKIEKVGTKRISTCIELLGSDYFLYLVPVWNLLFVQTAFILVTLADGSSPVPIEHVRSGFTPRNFGQQISWQVHRWRRSCQYQKVKLKLQMYEGFTWFWKFQKAEGGRAFVQISLFIWIKQEVLM